MATATPFDDAFAAGDVEGALRAIRAISDRSGLGRAYFHSSLQALGSNAERLRFYESLGARLGRIAPDLAWISRGRGAVAVGESRYRDAIKHFLAASDQATSSSERASFKIGAIEPLARIGKANEAIELANDVAASLRAQGEVAQAGRALVALGNALLKVDRHVAARDAFQSASQLLVAEEFPLEVASARLGVSTASLYGVDGDLAINAAVEARDRFIALGMPQFALQASLNLALESAFRGRPDESVRALAELESQALSPGSLAQIRMLRGGAYLKLNLWQEAAADFAEAAELARRTGDQPNVGLSQVGQALALVGQGRALEAGAIARRAVGRFRRLGNDPMQARSLAILAECECEARPRSARMHWGRAIALAEAAQAPDVELEAFVQRAVFAARVEAPVRASLPIRLRNLAAHPEYAWRLRYAEALSATNETRALAAFDAMLNHILEGRLLVVSATARMTFLRDKEVALRQYLTRLLADPTPERVQQALSVVGRTRSVALADEITSANPSWLSEDARATLDALRQGEAGEGQDGIRRVVSSGLETSRSRGQLAAIRIQLSSVASQATSSSATPMLVIAGSENHWHLLSQDQELGRISRADLDRDLNWLAFEISEPRLRPEAPADHALKRIEDLRQRLNLPARSHLPICPEGVLWRVPWAAICDTEPVLALGPDFHLPEDASLPAQPKVALWVHPHRNLPQVEIEAAQFLARFPDAIVCRTVLEARALLAGGRVDLLHVTGHATHLPENPMMSAFQFSDGWITAAEIAMSDFHAGFAYLSACDTGRMGSPEGLEPDGLVRALLARGARGVVASLWALSDSAGAVLADAFLSQAIQGVPYREALGFARRKARNGWEHPFYWAGLTLFAGYLHQRTLLSSASVVLRESCQARETSV